MAVQNPAVFLQAGTHPAEDIRRFVSALVGDRPGIVAPGDLAVTQTATASMNVQVAGGRAFVKGTENTYQGLYFVENRGPATLAIAPADSTNSRYDLVIARVRDAAYSGSTSAWALEVVTGTASPSPSEPAVPANALVLARVTVDAGATTITNANIADRRTTTIGQGNATALGGVVPCTSSTRPTAGLYEGLTIYETDTDRTYVYAGSDWRYVGPGDYVCTSTSRPTAPFTGLNIFETDTGRRFVWVGSKWVFVGGVVPTVSVRRTTDGPTWTTAGVWVAIPWQTTLTNETTDNSMFNGQTPTRLTAPISGVYQAIGQGGLDKPNTGGDWYMGVRRGSDQAIFRGTSMNRPTNTPGEATVVAEVYLEAGDWVEVLGYSTTQNSFMKAHPEIGPRASLRLITARL